MRTRLWLGCLLCLLCVAGTWFLWQEEHGRDGSPSRSHAAVAPAVRPHLSPAVSSRGVINTNVTQISLADWNTNKFAGRLSNTTRSIGQLVGDRHAILLANALMDTSLPLNFVFPKNLQSQGDPGAYIVQARGPIDQPFRAMLAQAGATIVAYIPNDAYLVRASASVAGMLGANPQTQAVVPYEPYYKIQSSLLYPAVNQNQLADGEALNLGLFADDAPATVQQIEQLGGQVIGNDQSPFGPVVRVIPPQNWTALATLSGVQIVEPFHLRAVANDLSRAANGVAADSLTATNYLALTGAGVTVEVNDTGIDAQHPDLIAGGNYGKIPGVIGDAPQSLVDTDGHGTHVAGIIAGDGAESTTVTNVPGSTLPGGTGTNYEFRGMAPGATLYSVGGIEGGADTNVISDMYFQEVPALTNALISNNSWVYEGDSAYDLSAASYDAATRDALPFVTGSQPVLFVFAAGNAGDGSDSEDLGGGVADSIESPATAKDVITVGAIQEDRNISVAVTNADGSPNTTWADETSTGYRVAGFSSRGNVGVGIEGTFGRYKPDVCAPGTFTLSTRSEQWDIGTYFYQNPTNDQSQYYTGFTVQPGSIVSRPFPTIPTNTVECQIWTFPNANSPFSFADLPLRITLFGSPTVYGPFTNYPVLIPGTTGTPSLMQILGSQSFFGFNFAISNNTPNQVIFDLQTDIITTNGSGNYFLALSNLDNSIGTPNPARTGPGPYYRYETGTSMAAADVSGVLALIQQFYFNAYNVLPSPTMLKAMLINGGQATGLYNFLVQNTLNYEGWGLVNLPDSLPPGVTNQLNVACSAYLQDQSPANALATGGSQTYQVNLTSNAAPLRVTLAWTDPPGDPAAAIKLVNNLVLVVTNLSNPTNPIVYYGNDIDSSTVNNPHATNTPPVFDSINNVQNVYLQPGAGTSFTVTVLGYRVNVNAVTAQTNNVVQDYALVISTGNSGLTNVMTVTSNATSLVYNATGDQQVTYPSQTSAGSGNTATSFAELLNQFVGANSPLLGTNTIVFSPSPITPEGFGPTNWQATVGQANQWQFYVVTNPNPSSLSNAAFITFNPNAPDPDTLSVPRLGVFADSVGNATREADIDMYVTTDSSITNLNPAAISNAVVGTQIGGPPGGLFAGASLGPGTTEFVVDTNSWSRPTPNVYYIGIKSEDQQSAEYGFIAIFSAAPFSTMNNGVQTVNGVPVPMNIPDGSPTVPGKGYVFGLAIYPETVGTVTVANEITHQNFGDLIGTLTLNGANPDVLNNHDSFGNPPGPYFLTYDDSAGGGVIGSRRSDGPGSLVGYFGQQALGVWMLNEVDDSLTQTGAVNNFTTTIQPYQKPTVGVVTNYVPGGSWVYGFVDVPPGATNLTIYATNFTALTTPGQAANPPVELFVQYGTEPTTNSFIPPMVVLNPNGVFSLGPPLVSGRYFYGLLNPNPNSPTQEIHLFATIGGPSAPQTIYSSGDTPIPILDDAVTTDSIIVPDNQTIASLEVALRVQHPRISDLVFHLIGPDGTRDLLVENRGGTDPNGMGATINASNFTAQTFSGGAETSTNVINTGSPNGTLQVSYNFFTLPDELAVFNADGTTNFDSGMISGAGLFSIPYTNSTVEIVMNPFGNTDGPGDAWTYTVTTLQTNQYTYLVLTEDTNETTTPIKFAIPPFGTTNVTVKTNYYFGLTNLVTNADLYYLPEQALDAYDGDNAAGTWMLEIQDDRAGATEPPPQLLSWQLRFNYVTTGTSPNGIPSGPQTNVIQPGSWIYYPVNVPTNADYATNILVSATGPLDMWFNQNNNPVANPGAGDVELIPGAITGSSSTLSTFSVPTNIVPGGVYYIGLYNPNAVPVTNVFEVNFHYFQIIPGSPGVPITNVVAGTVSGDGVNYYSFTVPPNADYATNLLVFSTTPVNVWFNQTKAPVCLSPPDSLLIANATSGAFVLSAGSTPPLVPGATYNIAIQNTNSPNATNVFEVNFHIYTPLTNGVPTTNSVPPNSFAYYTVTVPTNADYATNLLLFASTNVNVWFNQYAPPIGVSPADSLLISNATSGVSILSATSAPPLVPGAIYYLGVQNTNAVAVTFGLEVNFHFVSVVSIPVTGPTITATNINGTNGFLLQWSGPTNDQYTIQWTTNLSTPILWNTVLNPVINLVVTPTNGDYSWFDDGSLAGGWPPEKFYRVVANLLSGPITNSTPVTNIVVSGTITPLTVTVPANAIAATNLLIFASGPVDVWFNQTTPPTGNTGAGDVLMVSTNTSGTFVLTGSSVPPLVPGANYYLGVQSLGTSNVSFSFQVNFAYGPPTNPPSISSITVTNVNGTNAILLQWTEPTNYQFQVEWATNLAPAIAWHTISNVVVTWSGAVSPTNAADGIFQFLDDGSLTGGWGPLKFYRLIEYPYSTPIPQTLTIINTAIVGNAVWFQWVAPTNYQYQVLWTTNLGLPLSNWSVLANPALGLSNGVYTFTDTNQTGPATSPKFFRLLEH
ncbi:MAG: S8 family serine peptidase [Verrucomicrobiia bacterium]